MTVNLHAITALLAARDTDLHWFCALHYTEYGYEMTHSDRAEEALDGPRIREWDEKACMKYVTQASEDWDMGAIPPTDEWGKIEKFINETLRGWGYDKVSA